MLSAKERDTLFRQIWNGTLHVRNLPENLYFDIAKQLQKAVVEGFGAEAKNVKRIVAQIEGPDLEVLESLNQNIFAFSAAKTFQQVNDMSNFLFDEQGFKVSFKEFTNNIDPVYKQYNQEWLRTEFDTAVSQARSAAQWQNIQRDKETLPLLKYQTAGDSKVRPEHAAWDNIVRPVDDPWWDTHMPPNGFSCRCIAIQLDEGKTTDLRGVKRNEDKLFAMNPGKDELIFQEKGKDMHPYFKVDQKFTVHKSNNFGLPLPE